VEGRELHGRVLPDDRAGPEHQRKPDPEEVELRMNAATVAARIASTLTSVIELNRLELRLELG
jgi:hypothetical protein